MYDKVGNYFWKAKCSGVMISKNAWCNHCLNGLYLPVNLIIYWVIIPPQNEQTGEICVWLNNETQSTNLFLISSTLN